MRIKCLVAKLQVTPTLVYVFFAIFHNARFLQTYDAVTTPQNVEQYPNIVKLASVTSVECEQGFSLQNRIKTNSGLACETYDTIR